MSLRVQAGVWGNTSNAGDSCLFCNFVGHIEESGGCYERYVSLRLQGAVGGNASDLYSFCYTCGLNEGKGEGDVKECVGGVARDYGSTPIPNASWLPHPG